MKQGFAQHIRIGLFSVCSLFLVLLFAACSGVVTTNGPAASNGTSNTASQQITGTITKVDTNSVTLMVNNQTIVVSGLTSQQTQALQSAIGKQYTFQVTLTGSNSYQIVPSSNYTEDNNTTPQISGTNASSVPASIKFTGQVQNSSSSSVTVTIPGDQPVQITIASTTKIGDNGIPGNGSWANVEASYINGSFVATKLETAKPDDVQKKQNTVEYQGQTTSAVGSDGKLNIQVGNKSYSFQMNGNTELKHLISAQSIQNNMPVKVSVAFNGSTGTVMSVENANDNS